MTSTVDKKDLRKDDIQPRKHKSQSKVVNCAHTDRKMYAKGMCNSCYHKFGRPTRATKCAHTDK